MPWNGSAACIYDRASIARSAPTRSGVYVILSLGRWLYVGESGSIRGSLSLGLSGNDTPGPLRSAPAPIDAMQEDPMNIQEWLASLLSRPATDPLDWESYCVTMDDSTWKSLCREIEATQAYEDGLEAGLRLLQATQHHRERLGGRGYQANQILLYRSILSMLDRAERWDAYLAAWETIRTHTTHCLPLKGDALLDDGPRLAPFVRRADGGFGVPPLPYGTAPPKTIAVHFLHTQLRRKTLIERKLARAKAGTLGSDRRPLGWDALTGEEIEFRLAQIQESAG
jgi:hypothetical protein